MLTTSRSLFLPMLRLWNGPNSELVQTRACDGVRELLVARWRSLTIDLR